MTTKVPNSMLVSPGGGGSSLATAVSYSNPPPLDGNYWMPDQTLTSALNFAAPTLIAEGGSCYVQVNANGHIPTFDPAYVQANSVSWNSTHLMQITFGYLRGPQYILQDKGVAPALPVFTAQSAPGGTVAAAYTYTYAATGATSFSLASGSLPVGLTLNTSTGVLSGTPMTAATSTFVIAATNTTGTNYSTSQSVVIAAASAPVFSAQSAPGGNVATAYSYTYVASGTTSFSVLSGSLPAGLSLNTSTGVLSGTPTTVATSTFVIQASGPGGNTSSTGQSVAVSSAGSASLVGSQTTFPGSLNLTTKYDIDWVVIGNGTNANTSPGYPVQNRKTGVSGSALIGSISAINLSGAASTNAPNPTPLTYTDGASPSSQSALVSYGRDVRSDASGVCSWSFTFNAMIATRYVDIGTGVSNAWGSPHTVSVTCSSPGTGAPAQTVTLPNASGYGEVEGVATFALNAAANNTLVTVTITGSDTGASFPVSGYWIGLRST